jgi:hypothetical protein
MFISLGFGFRDINFLIYTNNYIHTLKLIEMYQFQNVNTQTNQINQIMPIQMAPPTSGAHGMCPACHTLDTPLGLGFMAK